MNTDKKFQPCWASPLLKVDSDRSLAAEGRDSIPDKVYLVFMVDAVTLALNFPPRNLIFPPVTLIPPMLHTYLHVNNTLIRRTSGRKRRAAKCSRIVSENGNFRRKDGFKIFSLLLPECIQHNDRQILSKFHTIPRNSCCVTHSIIRFFFPFIVSLNPKQSICAIDFI